MEVYNKTQVLFAALPLQHCRDSAKTHSFQSLCGTSRKSWMSLLSIDDYQLTLSELIWWVRCGTLNVRGRKKAAFSFRCFTEDLQTVGKLFNFCYMVLNLQWWIQQESCHSFSRNLHLLSVCTHTQRPHTLVPSRWNGLTYVTSFFLYMSSGTAVQRELYHCFAEILVLLVDKTYFSTVTCVTVVYSFVAVRHLVQCYLLRWSQILFRSTRIFLSWGAQLCSVGFSYSFWVPKVAFYSSSVSRKKNQTYFTYIYI